MIKFNEFDPDNTKVTDGTFEDPNRSIYCADPEGSMLRYGWYAVLARYDINKFWKVAHLSQPVTSYDLSIDDNEPLPIPVVHIIDDVDEHSKVEHSVSGLKAFIKGAKSIPVIEVRTATDEQYRKFLKYPSSMTIKNGILYLNSETSGYPPLAVFDGIVSMKHAQEIIDKIVKRLQLTESVNTGNVVSAFRRFSNQSFPVGKITRDESTNSYCLFLDKNNNVSITMIPALTSPDEDCLSLFVTGNFHLDDLYVNMLNCDQLADNLASAGNLFAFAKRLHNTAIYNQTYYNSVFMYQNSGINPQFTEYTRQLFISKAKAIIPDLTVTSNDIITVGSFDIGPIKYCFEIENKTNKIRFSITVNHFYVGNMVVTDDNQQKLIDNFNKLVKSVNVSTGLYNLGSIRDLLINEK